MFLSLFVLENSLLLELLPMVSYFSDVVKDLKDRTEIGTKVLMEGEGNAEVSCDIVFFTRRAHIYCFVWIPWHRVGLDFL